jgi:hypothetical protein
MILRQIHQFIIAIYQPLFYLSLWEPYFHHSYNRMLGEHKLVPAKCRTYGDPQLQT